MADRMGSVSAMLRRMVIHGDTWGYFGAGGNARQRRKLLRSVDRMGLDVRPMSNPAYRGQWRADRR